MKRSVKIMVSSTFICACLSISSLLMAAELIAPTRTLEGQNDQQGRLSVFSEPPELEVTLDGTEIGKTPVVARQVEPGIHILKVKNSETEIFVESGKEHQISWHNGSFIEIPAKKETPQQPQVEAAKPRQKKKTDKPSDQEEDLQPLYWPLNPRGPIF
jgi:hypothetical protein